MHGLNKLQINAIKNKHIVSHSFIIIFIPSVVAVEFKSIPVLRMASLKADVCVCFMVSFELVESTFSIMSYGGFLLLCAHYSTEYKH